MEEWMMIVARRLALVVVATMAVLAACSGSGGAATSPPAGATVTIGLATSATLGQVLTGAGGLTLYTHSGDTATSSSCTGSCATSWPPLLVTGGAAALLAAGLGGTVGSFSRSDGLGTQVTFDGKPLYYWQGDTAAGATTGQGLNGFTVATPGGAAPAASPTPAATHNSGY